MKILSGIIKVGNLFLKSHYDNFLSLMLWEFRLSVNDDPFFLSHKNKHNYCRRWIFLVKVVKIKVHL